MKGKNKQKNYMDRIIKGRFNTQYALSLNVTQSDLRAVMNGVCVDRNKKQEIRLRELALLSTEEVDALFDVEEDLDELGHDVVDKEYVEKLAQSIVDPLEILLKDKPNLTAREAKQAIGIDHLRKKDKKASLEESLEHT
eukprot:602754_1